jgi:alkylation response protein AidB-like acyl-CoA dehydrogenase
MRASPCGVEATAAKYLAAEASDELSLRAVRAHGGFGFAWSTSFDPHPVVHDRAFCRNVRGAPRRLPLTHDIEGARRKRNQSRRAQRLLRSDRACVSMIATSGRRPHGRQR